jgi:hypothetical protein
MRTYIKTNWILLTTVLVLSSLLFVKCENEKILTSDLDILHIKMETYKLKNGQIVSSSETVTYEKVPNPTELTKKFAKPKTITKIVEVVRIDTVNIVYHDTITMPFERKGSIVSKDYSLDYKSTHKGISIANLAIKPDTVEIVTGMKRKWFLGRQTQTIDVTHSNPLVKTVGLQHIEIKEKKKFYETTFFKVGAGILLGATITR